MKRTVSAPVIILILTLTVATFAAAQSATVAPSTQSSPSAQSIARARTAISDKPEEYAGYNLLASALVRRAQETFDDTFYTQAETAIRKSLEISPHNFDSEKIEASILLGSTSIRLRSRLPKS
jgi:hypothetical protein